MRIHLKDYESCIHPMKDKENWELLHEESGFLDRDETLYDRDLIDLDGQETHLMHPMKGHSVHLAQKQKRMRRKQLRKKHR